MKKNKKSPRQNDGSAGDGISLKHKPSAAYLAALDAVKNMDTPKKKPL